MMMSCVVNRFSIALILHDSTGKQLLMAMTRGMVENIASGNHTVLKYYFGNIAPIPIKGWMISQGENMQPKSTIAL